MSEKLAGGCMSFAGDESSDQWVALTVYAGLEMEKVIVSNCPSSVSKKKTETHNCTHLPKDNKKSLFTGTN